MNYHNFSACKSLSLLTDLYELTMASAYLKTGTSDTEAVFYMHFRQNPFQGGFIIMCGLENVIAFLNNLRFDRIDLAYLGSLKHPGGENIFRPDFLRFLKKFEFACDVDAVPEGTVVFPHEPIVRVQGPLVQCQLLESIILNTLNFQSLIATKAARLCLAARGEPILEFGLRRAQGIDGALSASRAAYIGGCSATSNTLAGKLFGIPVSGTHAHSWVMAFDNELESFKAFAGARPHHCTLLIDTYDSIEGIKNAVRTGLWLRERGGELYGIRLDSGDLAYLSNRARALLDEAGLRDTKIFASNELDEYTIASLKEQEAKITVWGVGTKLVTGDGEPALGGVYKLSAVRKRGGPWNDRVKLSEQAVKISTPGILQAKRYRDGDMSIADAIYSIEDGIADGCTIIDPFDSTRRKVIPQGTPGDDLLVPVFRKGKNVSTRSSIHEIREAVKRSLRTFHPGIKRFVNPHSYPVGLVASLSERRLDLIEKTRSQLHREGKET